MFDVAIIGGGPAGYLAAERLGHAGKKVLLIEKSQLGGTCLNVGCIPTKTLLNSAKQYIHALEAHKFGVHAEQVRYDWNEIMNWKNDVVQKLRGGVASQMKRFSVTVAEGSGEILRKRSGSTPALVRVHSDAEKGKETEYECKAILVSTGSVPAMPPIPGARDNPALVDSTALLSVSEVPKRLAVIGGGVIGVEFASLFSTLGSEVSVIEMMDEIIPFMDKDQAPLLRRAMKKVAFKLGCKVQKLEGNTLIYTNKEGKEEQLEADLILMAVGRRPVLDGWGAEQAGLDLSSKGVNVDEHMRTNVPGIWAAGDVTGRSLLAHSAYRMAEVALADMLDYLDGSENARFNRMRYHAIPWAVYSLPEAAGAGITEQEAEAKGINILKASLPMKISGRFVAENTFAGPGSVKVIASASDGRILGIHALGAYASEFIWGAAALIEQELRIADVKQLIFPHPTVSEMIRDVCWAIVETKHA